ncbi:MAG: UDP-3-O-acyl-N-acetylglucosamine deacetylase [Rhodopirellula sp. JB044]|uniref:UDP-3-O-acyl-N-acetylglucosamine deacetylase n=1 Tax=Rhodopirellula sp. JB044 TaxID=3342844 RepID=UPI00370BCEAE
MIGYRNEHTIASTCEVVGRGYWSGQSIRVRFLPASAGTGIVFVRTDLPGHPQCPARIEFADSVQFRTNLHNGEACFAMVEHLMAALAGLEIDNCVVETDAEEMPGLDGSSDAYVGALQSAGLVIQAALKQQLIIDRPMSVRQGDACIEVNPCEDMRSHYGYRLDYGAASVIPKQSFQFDLTPRQFSRQVAAARTFVTLEQAQQLRAGGIAKHVSNQELLVIGEDGPVENQFRYRNECARHKTLDLIGDLSLVGVDLIGRFVSERGGHRLNGMLAQELSQMLAHSATPHNMFAPQATQKTRRAA